MQQNTTEKIQCLHVIIAQVKVGKKNREVYDLKVILNAFIQTIHLSCTCLKLRLYKAKAQISIMAPINIKPCFVAHTYHI
jgi:hypothetical protein